MTTVLVLKQGNTFGNFEPSKTIKGCTLWEVIVGDKILKVNPLKENVSQFFHEQDFFKTYGGKTIYNYNRLDLVNLFFQQKVVEKWG